MGFIIGDGVDQRIDARPQRTRKRAGLVAVQRDLDRAALQKRKRRRAEAAVRDRNRPSGVDEMRRSRPADLACPAQEKGARHHQGSHEARRAPPTAFRPR